MHLFYCDESNLEDRNGDFLIYGGIVIDGARAHDLSKEIDRLRNKAGVKSDFRLKFNPAPPDLSHSEFIELKESIIGAVKDHGGILVIYLILHNIAKNPDLARRNGINSVCFHFNGILNRLDSTGIVLIDRFNDAENRVESHLRDKFSMGVTGMPYSKSIRMNRIVGFHYSAIGQSHFPSVIDILIGSLRFAINAHTRGQTKNLPTAIKLLEFLAPLFFREDGKNTVSELGLQFSPKIISVDGFRSQYESLQLFLAKSGIDTEQSITNMREY